MEMGGTKNLRTFLEKREKEKNPLKYPIIFFLLTELLYRVDEYLYIFKQILEAINYLHKKCIAHMDIKAENVTINEKTLVLKIVDFGFAISGYDNVCRMNIFCGTPCYMAPEVFEKKLYDGRHCDIWAMGVLFHYVLTMNFPFHGKNHKELAASVREADWNGKFVAGCHVDLVNLFNCVFVKEGRNRPTAEDVRFF
jgi:serine/threonine protein kinase